MLRYMYMYTREIEGLHSTVLQSYGDLMAVFAKA